MKTKNRELKINNFQKFEISKMCYYVTPKIHQRQYPWKLAIN